MRLWLRDSERKPDPVPAQTDDRKAVLVGLGLWIVALVITLIFGRQLAAVGDSWWLWTVFVGLALGLIGLGYLSVKRR